jgi:hypothetical protein
MPTTERTLVETVKNFAGTEIARRYSDGTILIKDVRWSYPHVLIPKEGTSDNGQPTAPSFSIKGLMPKVSHGAARKMIQAEIQKLLAENKLTMIAADRQFLRNGDLAGKEEEKGMFTVSCRERAEKPPRVRGPDRAVWTASTHAQRVYGGCWGNILFRPWFQSNKYGKRVNANLIAVQFLRDGEPFGEGRISDEVVDDTFDDESEGAGVYADVDDL